MDLRGGGVTRFLSGCAFGHLHSNGKYNECIKKRFAFTLAEVLITLGIIGIVAAMTLPTVVNKYQKKETLTRLKRAYSLLNQAIASASAKHGFPSEWSGWDDSEEIVNKYIAPEIKVHKTYGTHGTDFFKGMCFEGRNLHGAAQYNWLTGVYISSPINGGTASLKTVDGICIGLRTFSYIDNEIFVDINGSHKGPNVAGKDLFFFKIVKNSIKPYGYNWQDGELTGSSTNACNPSAPASGRTCAARIMRENWEINYY